MILSRFLFRSATAWLVQGNSLFVVLGFQEQIDS